MFGSRGNDNNGRFIPELNVLVTQAECLGMVRLRRMRGVDRLLTESALG
jgi:hypothetical protein